MAQATWRRIATAASIQRSSQTIATLGSKACIYGGELRPREPVDSTVYVCDLLGKSNEQVSSVSSNASEAPQSRVGAVSTVLNNRLYVFSGRGGTAMAPIEENGAFWVLDPEAGKWSKVEPEDRTAPYPAGRSYHAVTNDGNKTVFIHAGCPEKGRLSDLWAFDTRALQWHELPPAPGPPRGGTSITYSDGIVYRMNGFDGKTEQGGAIDSFDLTDQAWSSFSFTADGSSGPEARSVSSLLAVKVQGRPHLCTMFGERDPSSLGHQGAGKMLDDVWLFGIEAKTWKKIEPQGYEGPAARGWFAADVVGGEGNDAIVVHGGLAESNERLGDVWLLQL